MTMCCSDRVRLRADRIPVGRHCGGDRLSAEAKPSLGFRRGLKRGRIEMFPEVVCAEKQPKRVAMAGLLQKRCLVLVEALIDHPYGEVFRDFSTLASIPTHGAEYLKRTINRMDLSTIKVGLEKGDYYAIDGFIGDLRLVFSNALMSFPVDNDVHTMAKRMSRDFEIELKNALSEIKKNAGEDISAVLSDSSEGPEESVSRHGFNDSAKHKSPIKSPNTVLETTGATPPRAALLKKRFRETILKAEMSLLGNGGAKKLKEMVRKRDREAAREALRKMEKSVKFSAVEDHKAVKELEHLCGCPLSDYHGRKVLSRLGLFLKDEAAELD